MVPLHIVVKITESRLQNLFSKTVVLRTTMVTESEDFRLITTLFAVQLSDQSGLVRKVQAAEDLLCQYELLTTTNFACIKQNQGFGCAGKVFQTICKPSKEKRKRGGYEEWG